MHHTLPTQTGVSTTFDTKTGIEVEHVPHACIVGETESNADGDDSSCGTSHQVEVTDLLLRRDRILVELGLAEGLALERGTTSRTEVKDVLSSSGCGGIHQSRWYRRRAHTEARVHHLDGVHGTP